jgi:hypothetical protein
VSKEYIGSQEHFEDEINAYYDELEERNRQQEKEINDQIYREMEQEQYLSNNQNGG